MFSPLLSPHLISDIVTTVAVCLTAKNDGLPLKKNDVAVRAVCLVRWSPVGGRLFFSEIGVTVKPLP